MERKLRGEQVIKGLQVDDGKDVIPDAAGMMRCGSASGACAAWNRSKTVLIQVCSLQMQKVQRRAGTGHGTGENTVGCPG